MFNGQCCKMRIRDQIRNHITGPEQSSQNLCVPRGRGWYPDGFTFKPGDDLCPRILNQQGVLENTSVGYDPKKRDRRVPRKTYRGCSIQLSIEPVSRSCMAWRYVEVGIDKGVRIDQYQRYDSRSATATTLAILSMLPTRQRPTETERVRKRLRRRAGRDICSSPYLNASLTISFRERLPALRSRSREAATSSSKVSVVLMHQNVGNLMS